MRIVIATVMISAMLTQASYAQSNAIPGTLPVSPEDKAEMVKKRTDEIETDKAYRSTIRQIPDSNQKIDPWGGVRTPSPADKR
jgi:hypothetical protein